MIWTDALAGKFVLWCFCIRLTKTARFFQENGGKCVHRGLTVKFESSIKLRNSRSNYKNQMKKKLCWRKKMGWIFKKKNRFSHEKNPNLKKVCSFEGLQTNMQLVDGPPAKRTIWLFQHSSIDFHFIQNNKFHSNSKRNCQNETVRTSNNSNNIYSIFL